MLKRASKSKSGIYSGLFKIKAIKRVERGEADEKPDGEAQPQEEFRLIHRGRPTPKGARVLKQGKWETRA